jgi:hypothetical protein
MSGLEETGGVDPVIEKTCAECGATLTDAEVRAALESGGPYLCQVHALENVPLDDEDQSPG